MPQHLCRDAGNKSKVIRNEQTQVKYRYLKNLEQKYLYSSVNKQATLLLLCATLVPRVSPFCLFIPGWGRNGATFRSERHLPCDNLSTRPRGELLSSFFLLPSFPPTLFCSPLGFDECSLAHNTSLWRRQAESQEDTEGMWKVYPWHASPVPLMYSTEDAQHFFFFLSFLIFHFLSQ